MVMLRVPGAELYYEVRGSGPLLVLVGAPMESDFFAPLAAALADNPYAESNGAYMLGHMLRPTTRYRPDLETLRPLSRRIVVGVGAASAAPQIARRGAEALATRLSIDTVAFPGDHGGFVSHPTGFVTVLRTVLPTAALD